MKSKKCTAEQVMRLRKRVAVSDVILLLFCSIVYSWSVFVNPIEAELGWTRSQTSLIFTICTSSNTVIAVFSAMLARKIGSKRVTQIFACIGALGFFGASQTGSLPVIYLCYGVMVGGTMGAVYNQVLTTIISWFKDKTGVMTGLMLMSYGMGSVFLSPILTALIEKVTWRGTFLFLSVFSLLLLLSGSFQTRLPSSEEALLLPSDPIANDTASSAAELSTPTEVRDYRPLDMVRTVSFWIFLLWNLLIGMIGLTMSGHAVPIAQSIGISAATAAFYVSLYSLFNGIGRLSYGVIFDRIGRRRCILLISFIAIGACTLLFTSLTLQNKTLLLIAFALLGFAFAGGPVSSAGTMKELFGYKYYGVNLSIANLAILLASFTGPYAAGYIYQKQGYHAVALLLLIVCSLSMLFAVLLHFRRKV